MITDAETASYVRELVDLGVSQEKAEAFLFGVACTPTHLPIRTAIRIAIAEARDAGVAVAVRAGAV